jgi:hypothetical protein
MTNDQLSAFAELLPSLPFVIRISGFIHHLTFVIRHSKYAFGFRLSPGPLSGKLFPTYN